MDMSLSKFQEMVKDGVAWRAVVHGVWRSWTRLSDWTTKRQNGASQVVLVIKNLPANAGIARETGSVPGSGRSPPVGSGNHSSILAWKIPWTEEPGRLQSMGSQRVGHDWSDLAWVLDNSGELSIFLDVVLRWGFSEERLYSWVVHIEAFHGEWSWRLGSPPKWCEKANDMTECWQSLSPGGLYESSLKHLSFMLV